MGMMCKLTAAQASEYGYQKDPTFSPDSPGESSFWIGKGAEKFGLDSTVKADFEQVINIAYGFDKSGEIRQVGKSSGEQSHDKYGAFDIVLSTSKSVSIMCSVDSKFQNDVVNGLKETQTLIDTLTQGWQTKDGIKTLVPVSAPTLAQAHSLARLNKDDLAAGKVEDPLTHVHLTIFNNTLREDGTFCTLENESLYDNQQLIRQFANNMTAMAMVKNGYEIEWQQDKQGVFYAEVAGISKEQRDEFSSRHNAIAKEKGENNSHQNDNQVQLRTKADKQTDRTIGELKEAWTEARDRVGIDAEKIMSKAQENKLNPQAESKLTLKEIVSIAISDVNATESKFKIEDVMKDALKLTRENFNPMDVLKAVNDTVKTGELVRHGELYTTPEMVKMENGIIKTANENIQEIKPMMTAENAQKSVSDFETAKGFTLSEGQADAVKLILTTTSRVNIINGSAGTGKTTATEAVYLALKDNPNIELIGLAPSNAAASQLEKDSGIKSQTIDSYVGQKGEAVSEGKLRVILVDEAGMVGSENMSKLMEKEKDNNTVFAYQGDDNQLCPVSAGQPYKDLMQTDIPKVFITEVQRQVLNKDGSNQYSIDATEAFKNHKVADGFQILKDAGKVTEVTEGREACIAETALRYVEANKHDDKMSFKDQLKLVGVATLTNADRLDLNEAIRTLQQSDKYAQIGKEDWNYTAEKTINLTASEKRQAINYEVGNFVNLTKDIKAGDITIKRGSTLEIVEMDANKNTITYNIGSENNNIKFNSEDRAELNRMKLDGTMIEINTTKDGNKLSQYSISDEKISLFEKKIFTDTDRSDAGKANSFVKDTTFMAIDRDEKTGLFTIALDNGKIVKDFDVDGSHTGAGSVSTAHKEQGKTYVHKISMILSSSSRMLTENINYVLNSRQKEELEVVTDNYQKVVEAATEAQEKTTTNDGTNKEQNPSLTNDQNNQEKSLTAENQDSTDKQNKSSLIESLNDSFEKVSEKLDGLLEYCESKVNATLFDEHKEIAEDKTLIFEAEVLDKTADMAEEKTLEKSAELTPEHQGQETGTGLDNGEEPKQEKEQEQELSRSYELSM